MVREPNLNFWSVIRLRLDKDLLYIFALFSIWGNRINFFSFLRYHRTVKDLALKRGGRIDQLCFSLMKIDEFYSRKALVLHHKILGAKKPSRAQAFFNHQHPDNADSYQINEIEEGKFKVLKFEFQNSENLLAAYTLTRNMYGCNRNICEVTCLTCPTNNICCHEMTCTCSEYARRNACKHLHILAMQTEFRPKQNLHSLDIERSSSPCSYTIEENHDCDENLDPNIEVTESEVMVGMVEHSLGLKYVFLDAKSSK